jgi:cell division protease FtsH
MRGVAGDKPDPGDYAEIFANFVRMMAAQGKAERHSLGRRIAEHIQTDPADLPVVSQDFESYDQPNLQVALDSWLARPGTSHEVVGISGEQRRYMGVAIADLVGRSSWGPPLSEGPVDYHNVQLPNGQTLACLEHALVLVSLADERLVLMVSSSAGMPVRGGLPLRLEVLAKTRDRGQEIVREIRRLVDELNVYRGHVISFAPGMNTPGGPQVLVSFHRLPRVEAADIVLPPGILERIERHTIGFSEHAEALLAAGRSLKRGMLLHGLPGTGKTLTVMYLCSRMTGRTAILTTGRGLGIVGRVAQLARELAPSMVVIEDVDLIAEERGQPHPFQRAGPLLFELLNELDGLRDDADVIFVLTTNRADILEPALAARPGRIDLAVELPLPDEDGRRRLLELYSRGLALEDVDVATVVEATRGAAPAYLKELLRKAALIALERGAGPNVSQADLDAAMAELAEGGELADRIIGRRPSALETPPGAPRAVPTGFPGWSAAVVGTRPDPGQS